MKIMKTQKFMKFTNEQKQLVCNLIYVEQLQSWKNAEINYNDFFYNIAEECIKAGIEQSFFLNYIENYINYLEDRENIMYNVIDIYENNKDNFATKFDYYYKIVTKAQKILKKYNI
jgi:hypothetical protein